MCDLESFVIGIRRMSATKLRQLKEVLVTQYYSSSLKTWEERNQFKQVFYKMSLVSRELRMLKELANEVTY